MEASWRDERRGKDRLRTVGNFIGGGVTASPPARVSRTFFLRR